MGKIAVFQSCEFSAYRNDVGDARHPDCPERMIVVRDALARASDLAPFLVGMEPQEATLAQLEMVHPPTFLKWLADMSKKAVDANAPVHLDWDTIMTPQSWRAAKLATGAGLMAVEALQSKEMEIDFAFAIERPCGHHALIAQAMGFSLVNHIAVAARHCLSLGHKRVLIIDWDVHHGNGTQQIFWKGPGVLVVSLQRYPQWPFSGWFTEIGAEDGEGYTVNVPLPEGTGDAGYLESWKRIVERIAVQFQPEVILLSAGYDAHLLDPLGCMRITTGGFAQLSALLADLARRLGVKVAAFLEGGYCLDVLGDCVVETLRAFAGVPSQAPPAVLNNDADPQAVADHIGAVCRHLTPYWECLGKAA